MADRSLLERLEEAGDAVAQSQGRGSIARFQASVLENVRRILNARQGCCETRPDLGMPDLNDVITRGPAAAFSVTRVVQEQIEMFEPRLRNVSIRFLPNPENPLQLDFHIDATLVYEDQTERISFDTVLSDDKRIRVSG